jgi:purine-nucleoside phosphorylase
MLQIKEATSYIQSIIGDFKPQFGIILGTGLGKLTTEIDVEHTINLKKFHIFPSQRLNSILENCFLVNYRVKM